MSGSGAPGFHFRLNERAVGDCGSARYAGLRVREEVEALEARSGREPDITGERRVAERRAFTSD
ncbi:hypothetical protein GCM10022236_32070 [Microlunatus ginsengisoli]|uniref:Uncharacterized protein n=1 Tax=Microlunatus ginsengisoli TaxID=363863 RepID=A0ABP7A949_9ACTN